MANRFAAIQKFIVTTANTIQQIVIRYGSGKFIFRVGKESREKNKRWSKDRGVSTAKGEKKAILSELAGWRVK